MEAALGFGIQARGRNNGTKNNKNHLIASIEPNVDSEVSYGIAAIPHKTTCVVGHLVFSQVWDRGKGKAQGGFSALRPLLP
ncbi:hypothetical protein SLA2020_109100 [Shorea laevis]